MESNNPKNLQSKKSPSIKPLTAKEKDLLIRMRALEAVRKRRTEAKEKMWPNYLTEAHKKNAEAATKQQAEWKESPASLEEELRRQRKREE